MREGGTGEQDGAAGEGGSGSGGSGGDVANSGGQSGSDPNDAADDSGPPDTACDGGACDAQAPGCETCVPEPPSGWLGPVVLADTSVNDCAAPFATARADLHNALDAPEASCTCECGTAIASCGSIKFRQGAAAACGAAGGIDTIIPTSDTCVEVQQTQSCGRGAFTAAATGATCAPLATKSCPPTSWGSTLRVCGGTVDSLGCESDEVCMPDVHADYLADACIYRAGLHACPAQWPDTYTGYENVLDERECSTCSCAASGTAECNTDLKVFSDAACTSMTEYTTVTGTTGSAVLSTLNPMYMLFKAPWVSGVSCTPNGGEPTGSATPVDKTTVCCR